MKHFLFLISLVLIPSVSFSEILWKSIEKSDTSEVYIGSISNSNFINVWAKERYENEIAKEDYDHNKYDMTQDNIDVRCSDRRAKINETSYYYQGKMVNNINYQNFAIRLLALVDSNFTFLNNFSYYPPNSYIGLVVDHVCGEKK